MSPPSDGGVPAGLLLAAGGGRRFGRPKALVRFHGEPLVRRGARLLHDGGCAPVAVVLGAAADEVETALGAVETVTGAVEMVTVRNPDWRSGMGSSVRAGLETLTAYTPPAPAVVVALVDQPLVSTATVRRLIDTWRRGAVVAVTEYDGHARHPMLFDRRVWTALHGSSAGDTGGRNLLRERPDWVQPVPCDAMSSPRDIDTADDLHELVTRPDPNPVGRVRDRAAKELPWS